MKLLMLMLFLGSSLILSNQGYSATVGEDMKADCTKIISVERDLKKEVDSEEVNDEGEGTVIRQ